MERLLKLPTWMWASACVIAFVVLLAMIPRYTEEEIKGHVYIRNTSRGTLIHAAHCTNEVHWKTTPDADPAASAQRPPDH